MTKNEIIDSITRGQAHLHSGQRLCTQDWKEIYDEAMDMWAKEIATKALLHHGISTNAAHYNVEQLLKNNQ